MKTGQLTKKFSKNLIDYWHKNKLLFDKILKPSFSFRRVNAWPSRALRERRCAAAVISEQRYLCSMC